MVDSFVIETLCLIFSAYIQRKKGFYGCIDTHASSITSLDLSLKFHESRAVKARILATMSIPLNDGTQYERCACFSNSK